MSEPNLDAIEARAAAATMGPWESCWPGQCCDGFCMDEVGIHGASMSMSDVEFIQHARRDVPVLVTELREAKAKLTAIRRMQPYDAREVGQVLDYDSVHDILDGGAA